MTKINQNILNLPILLKRTKISNFSNKKKYQIISTPLINLPLIPKISLPFASSTAELLHLPINPPPKIELFLLPVSNSPDRTDPKAGFHDPTGPDYEDPEEPDHVGHQHRFHVRLGKQGQGLRHQ
jgi:hypothetical protein